MPVFDFQHEEGGEIISVLVRHTEPDSARAVQIVDGKTYKRVFSAPLAAKDTLAKDGTKDDFKRITEGKNLTVGQMWDISKELSKQREERCGGVDPVKEKFYKDYQKKTGGKHADVLKREQAEQSRKVLEQWGVKVG